ncbi:uncharacterized protein LOC133192224 [Saccostrea echinata]|uniref:uncharacterized protein LOC133192224 n=1 Tax=Saccostrea echinata TaxID=191078 RepID=UPI002A8143F6|nr:uncharacterized protein LOC133192224 [Saccostrea echinata]
MAYLIRRKILWTLQYQNILRLSLQGPKKLGNGTGLLQYSNLNDITKAMFATSSRTFSNVISKINKDKKLKLLDEKDEVIKHEVTHEEADIEAKHRNLKMTILKDPKTSDMMAFKLITMEEYKDYKLAQQGRLKVKSPKNFKITTTASDYDSGIMIRKIENVLMKGHPVILMVTSKSEAYQDKEQELHARTKKTEKLIDFFESKGYVAKQDHKFYIHIKQKK